MFGNGVGTGVATDQAVRLQQARRLGLTAVSVAAVGTATMKTSASLLISTRKNRTCGTITMASVLCERQNDFFCTAKGYKPHGLINGDLPAVGR